MHIAGTNRNEYFELLMHVANLNQIILQLNRPAYPIKFFEKDSEADLSAGIVADLTGVSLTQWAWKKEKYLPLPVVVKRRSRYRGPACGGVYLCKSVSY